MTRSAAAFFLAILGLAALFTLTSCGEKEDRPAASAEEQGRKSARSQRTGGRVRPERAPLPTTPLDSATYLRNLLGKESSMAPSFKELEGVVRQLERDDLDRLIESVGMEDASGVSGWLRCALFAELGRRDPQAALALMDSHPSETGVSRSEMQAFVSLYRGWAEVRPLEAHAALEELTSSPQAPGSPVYGRLTTVIFRELARADATTAWKLIEESEGGLANEDALAGFFSGLHDAGEVEEFLADWNSAQWDTDAAREAHAAYDRDLNRTNGSAARMPPEELIVERIAAAWAQHDLDGALAWLADNGPGHEHYRTWRASRVARAWATANPSEAVARLNDERYRPHLVLMGQGAIAGDPTLATEIIQQFDDYVPRAAILTAAINQNDSLGAQSYFPDPGGATRPGDPAVRYHSLLEAVDAADFPEQRRSELQLRLHQQFREELPEAAEAYEALQAR